MLDPTKPERVIEILELRLGVETEAAALAAVRATVDQKLAIQGAVEALADIAKQGQQGVDEDLRFHAAIAEATGNPMFPVVVNFLTEHFRASIQAVRREGQARQAMLHQVVSEHALVAEAIGHGDSDEARWAIRRHLLNGRQRVLASLTT
jgi:DNA-binding FadR family transcriptional regulator